MSRRILVITAGTLPVLPNSQVSGVGTRSWSIATSLRKFFKETYIAVPKDFANEVPNWCLTYENLEDLESLARQFDVIIAPYGERLIPALFQRLPRTILKIADGYTPSHVEFMARDVELTEPEVEFYKLATEGWRTALSNCDVLLATSTEQQVYYSGMQFALGKINPRNYQEIPILLAPFGINPSQVISKPSVSQGPTRTILWYGGFYPWLDFELFSEICKTLERKYPDIRILVAGALNPQIQENSFTGPASIVISELADLSNVQFMPWTEYGTRLESFSQVDGVISLNKLGLETRLSWRLRYADIVAMTKPLFTNGGDPFGERLVASGAGLKIEGDAEYFSDQINSVLYSDALFDMSTNMYEFAQNATWDSYYSDLVTYLNQTNSPIFDAAPQKPYKNTRVPKSILLIKELILAFTKLVIETGFRNAIWKAVTFPIRQYRVKKVPLKNRPGALSGYLAFFHQLDFSGAPRVGFEVIETLRSRNPEDQITVVVPKIIDLELIQKLRALDVDVVVRSADEKLQFGDVKSIFINSSATPWAWIRDSMLDWKNAGSTYPFVFFNHEQDPEIYFDLTKARFLQQMQKQGVMFLVPSMGTQKRFENLYNLGLKSKIVKLKVSSTQGEPIENKAESLNIILVGHTFDGRKKHLEVLAAVVLARQKAQLLDHARPIKLSFVGVGEDPIGREVRKLGTVLSPENSFLCVGRVSFSESSLLLGNANVVVSMNEKESFALYVAEAMSGGAVVLRTDGGGSAETVEHGVNGFRITDSIEDLADKILFLADKAKFTNNDFELMMGESQRLVRPYLETNYDEVAALLKGATEQRAQKSR